MMEKITLDKIFSEKNISDAMKIVIRKKASAGCDGLEYYELHDYWMKNRRSILRNIKNGTYEPVPKKMFFLIKPGKNERRRLCAYSAVDKMLQQCIRFELDRFFTPLFSPNSFGYIKGRGTKDAVQKCLTYINDGMVWVVDADIRKCFDSIRHSVVAKCLKTTADTETVNLIMKYIKVPSIYKDKYFYNRIGLPQGSCMSPVLANIVLNYLDRFYELNNIAFVRYADDLVVFCQSRNRADEILQSMTVFLENELSLKLNEDKTAILKPSDLNFLGYSFSPENGHYVCDLNHSAKCKMEAHMKKNMTKTHSDSVELINRLGAVNRGWVNYFSYVSPMSIIPFIRAADRDEMVLIEKKFEQASIEKEDVAQLILKSDRFVSLTEWYCELKERSGEYGTEIRKME